MISRERVLELIYPLIVNFGDPGQERLDMDCESLSAYTEEVIKDAVDYLIREKKTGGYPLFGEIFDALEWAFENRKKTELEKCPACGGSGFVYIRETNSAKFCRCRIGRRKRAGFIAYEENKHHGEREAVLASRKAWDETI